MNPQQPQQPQKPQQPHEIKTGNIHPGATCWIVIRMERPPEQHDDLTLAHMALQVGGLLRMIERERERRIELALGTGPGGPTCPSFPPKP